MEYLKDINNNPSGLSIKKERHEPMEIITKKIKRLSTSCLGISNASTEPFIIQLVLTTVLKCEFW
uniref:hypothetical protein n=1 Tax=Escherichia coli TaxID=562 RepID=UPI002354913E|nr:hypothetical protein [Escherichia coli]